MSSRQSCGGTRCGTEVRLSLANLRLEGEDAWVLGGGRGLRIGVASDGGLLTIDVRCTPGGVLLLPGAAKARSAVAFAWDARARRLVASRETRARLKALGRPLGTEDSVADARALTCALGWIPDAAGARLGEAALALVRQSIAAQAFETADEARFWYVHELEVPSLAPEARALDRELEQARAATAPLSIRSARDLGPLAWRALPSLPPAPLPDAYWDGDRPCVAEDRRDPARARCFDRAAGEWRAAARLVEGVVPERRLPVCFPRPCGPYDVDCVRESASGEDVPACCRGVREEDVLAGTPDSIVVARGGLRTCSRAGDRALSEDAAGALVATTPGSRLLAGSRFALGSGTHYGDVHRPQRTWDLAVRPPDPAQCWSNEPAIASPNQRSVVAFSRQCDMHAPGAAHAWLLEIGSER